VPLSSEQKCWNRGQRIPPTVGHYIQDHMEHKFSPPLTRRISTIYLFLYLPHRLISFPSAVLNRFILNISTEITRLWGPPEVRRRNAR
jgi:hypothetical protein